MAGLNNMSYTTTLHRIIRLLCPFPLMTTPLLVPLTRGPHVIYHGVVAERSPQHKQVVDRQSHTTTKSIIIMIQMYLRYKLKTAISTRIPPKLPANCNSVRQLQQQQDIGTKKKTSASTEQRNKNSICQSVLATDQGSDFSELQ